MQRPSLPLVRPGQPVRAEDFEQVRRAVYAGQLIPGKNIRLRVTPAGTIIEATSGQAFVCQWQVALQGSTAATIRPGSVNAFPATLKGDPLDGGKTGQPAPILNFPRPKIDARGRGYICAEVTFDPSKKWAVVKVEPVQVADWNTEDGKPGKDLPDASGGSAPLSGNRARHPLAMLLFRNDGRVEVEQITCFDLQHRARLGADQVSASRHFFF